MTLVLNYVSALTEAELLDLLEQSDVYLTDSDADEDPSFTPTPDEEIHDESTSSCSSSDEEIALESDISEEVAAVIETVQFINDDILDKMVSATNRTYLQRQGREFGMTVAELKKFIGVQMVMSAINLPKISLFWSKKYGIDVIKTAMTRRRFFNIRSSLKVVFDDDVTAEEKNRNKIWKVAPLFDSVLFGCRSQERPIHLSIDEMIVPFSGQCGIRQYCPGKPTPVGTVKCTTVKLADMLLEKGYHGTGTIARNRIPKSCLLSQEKIFMKRPRRTTETKCRNDGTVNIIRWLDNKPVTLVSTYHSNESFDLCRRWSKKNKVYEMVHHPVAVKAYNQFMGGVDLADRTLSVCPARARTRKSTIRFICHMIDLAVSNAWLLHKKIQIEKGTPKNKIQQLRSFKLELGEHIIETNNLTCNSDSCDEREDLDAKHIIPIPSETFRFHKADHLTN
ncbi:transposase is4 [Holotrichia oblita]|uniref:Transposase is4 n=1 Tax=Holotrichia oblita TaxID=644536 RepID=A0ACB9TLI2_HOLOL|nr:transposase is4 [Holotrichia oblita]